MPRASRALPPASTQLKMLVRLAREVAAGEGAQIATVDHLRKVLFSHRVATMLDLAAAMDAAPPAEKQRLGDELAKAEESFRSSLRPPDRPPGL